MVKTSITACSTACFALHSATDTNGTITPQFQIPTQQTNTYTLQAELLPQPQKSCPVTPTEPNTVSGSSHIPILQMFTCTDTITTDQSVSASQGSNPLDTYSDSASISQSLDYTPSSEANSHRLNTAATNSAPHQEDMQPRQCRNHQGSTIDSLVKLQTEGNFSSIQTRSKAKKKA